MLIEPSSIPCHPRFKQYAHIASASLLERVLQSIGGSDFVAMTREVALQRLEEDFITQFGTQATKKDRAFTVDRVIIDVEARILRDRETHP